MNNIENPNLNPDKILAPQKRDKTREPPVGYIPIDGAILTSNVPLESLLPPLSSVDSLFSEARGVRARLRREEKERDGYVGKLPDKIPAPRKRDKNKESFNGIPCCLKPPIGSADSIAPELRDAGY